MAAAAARPTPPPRRATRRETAAVVHVASITAERERAARRDVRTHRHETTAAAGDLLRHLQGRNTPHLKEEEEGGEELLK